MLPNLWLMAQMLFKVSLLTGVGPGFAAILIWEFVCRGERKLHLVRTNSVPSWAGVRRRDAANHGYVGADRPSFSRQFGAHWRALGRGPALPPMRSRR